MRSLHRMQSCPSASCAELHSPTPCCRPAPSQLQLLGWVMDRGSLVRPLLTLPQFVAVYALPITPADNQGAF